MVASGLRRQIMGSASWTLIQLLILVSLHRSSQMVELTTKLPGTEEDLAVPLPEDLPMLAPVWLHNNQAPSYAGSNKGWLGLSGPTDEVHTLDSEQLQLNMMLQDNTRAGDGSDRSPSTYIPTPTNRLWTEIASGGPPMEPLVTSPQLPSPRWHEVPSPFSSPYSTGAHVTLVPLEETALGWDTAHSYPVSKEEGVSSVPTDLVSIEPLPSVWASPAWPAHDTPKPTVKSIVLVNLVTPTAVGNLDKRLATGGSPLGISEITPGDFHQQVPTEPDGQLTARASDRTSRSPSVEEGNVVTSEAGSRGSFTAEDSSSSSCGHANSENCGFTLIPTPIDCDLGPYLDDLFLTFPPLFITLHSDWNTSEADWGIAWDALVYGSVGLFGSVVLLSILSLLGLVFRCPPGSCFFAALHMLLIAAGSSRAFVLFYDAYGHRDRLPAFTALLLHDLAYPCMMSSFGIIFLLLSSRSRLQHSSPSFMRNCLLAAAVFLHFFVSIGAVVVVDLQQKFSFLLLVSRGVYVALGTVLSLFFFIFCCVACTQNTQIYDLKNSAPPTEYTSGYPFANSKDWSRAARTALVSAFFGLLNAGLQLYAMLHAMGYGGSILFSPWPWWAFQLGVSLSEVGICLSLALVGFYPVFCSNDMGRTNCWTKLFHLSPGHVTMKAPILPTNSQWASSQHEKLLVCDTIIRSDSEFFPLYTLVEKHQSLGEDLSLIYHSSKSLEMQGLSVNNGSKTPSFLSVQIDSDSTVDFRPPSPIDLRRSIDEALFSESLIPKSLFHGTALSSSLSLTIKSATQLEECVFKEKAADRGLYRTSSCMEIETGPPVVDPTPNTSRQDTTASPSPRLWRGDQSTASSLYKVSLDGSSLVLCSSPEHTATSSFNFEKKLELSQGGQSQGVYRALLPPSQESLDMADQSGSFLRDDFIDVFGPIDALSVGSDTIDL
ncbi:proline-rich transmembrane protein 4 isoform X2 [Ascaphus truei]